MFEVGFSEIVLVFIVALLVLGPERLPHVIRTAALWLGRFKRSYNNLRADIESEIGADEIRRQLHNEEVLARLKASEQELRQIADDLQQPAGSTPAAAKAPAATAAHEQPAHEQP